MQQALFLENLCIALGGGWRWALEASRKCPAAKGPVLGVDQNGIFLLFYIFILCGLFYLFIYIYI